MVLDWGAHGKLPCEIWCFVDLSEVIPDGTTVPFRGLCLENAIYALVESADYVQDEAEIAKSDFFMPIKKEVHSKDEDGNPTARSLYLADVEAFLEPVVVVPNVGSEDKCMYFQVKRRKTWANEFIKWVELPHNLDEIEDSTDEEEEEEEEVVVDEVEEEED